MQRIKISKRPKKNELKEAVDILRKGGMVVYPTDTVYGLAVDALNVEAIGKLFVLKQRSQKPLPVIAPNMSQVKEIAEISKENEKILKKFWPGAIMFLLPKRDKIPDALTLGLKTVGIRIPDSYVATELARMLGNPITSTSANISGDRVGSTIDEVMRQLGLDGTGPDLYLDVGELPDSLASTIVDLTSGRPKVIRQGPVSFEA